MSLEMQNFKGCQSQVTELSEAGAVISGRNGSGKTRHFDAFFWCLFGKDSQDRKDYELKTRDSQGTQLQKVETSVTATMRINDEVIKFKRAFVEDWVKPRGQKEQVLKKHHTECFINDVPMSVGEYTKRVTEIMDDSLMKMLTNPLYFATMDWKKQREMLFNIAGSVTDKQIAEGNADYSKLLDELSGKSMEDYRKEIAMRKKKAKDELSQVQPRIDQTYSLMPKDQDWSLIANQINDCDERLEHLENEINDSDVQMAELLADNAKKRAKIEELKADKQRLVAEANQKLRQDSMASEEAERKMRKTIKDYEWKIVDIELAIGDSKKNIERNESNKARLVEDIKQLRQDWYNKYKETIPEDSSICPHCGQKLPWDRVSEIRDRFEKDKTEALESMTARGKQLNKELEEEESRLVFQKSIMEDLTAKKEEYADFLEKAKKEYEANHQETKVLKESDLKECGIIDLQIQQIQNSIQEPKKNTTADVAKEEKRMTREHRDALVKILNDRETRDEMKKEIDKLEERGRFLAGEIAGIEQKEDIISSFTKAKIRECESRVNHLFTLVKWKLFDYTLEGGEFEVCTPMVNGVPFPSANTAGRIQAGLDIIKVLQNFFNTQAVIFIDNRESIQDIPDMNGTQIINLQVADCELTINNNF